MKKLLSLVAVLALVLSFGFGALTPAYGLPPTAPMDACAHFYATVIVGSAHSVHDAIECLASTAGDYHYWFMT